MHFRPPAKALVAALPSGTPLLLEPEPSNQYDPFAVKVLVNLTGMDDEFWDEIETALGLAGVEKKELLAEPRHIAYIDKAKTGSAKIVFEAMAVGHKPSAKLGFDGNGAALVTITWTEAE
jgi:hypothetical protein